MIIKKIIEPLEIIQYLHQIYNDSNPQVIDFFLKNKKDFMAKNSNLSLYCIYENDKLISSFEANELSSYPVPVVEKNVLFLTSFNVIDNYKNNIDFMEIINKILTELKEKYDEILLLSSPFNDNMNVIFKNLGFAPLLNYENYLKQSSFWMYKSFNSSFIKRIPMNFEILRKDNVEKYEVEKIYFKLYANFQEFFHCEVYHYLNFIKNKFPKSIEIEIIHISSKKQAIKYGTDFCILMDNKIINPVNLMKLDVEEYLKII
ncbi:MAG: hypothetical protein M0R46_00975 [Candidatus Muirbacterium halophilum]|nr:hypothetical protein [Candidatus Muirbacterium halophilum]MCK9474467.1 hypothetical protein [Candidatus Muirbacterium halophilum]